MGEKMKAVLLKDFGDVSQMYIGETDKPILKTPHDVLVRVKTTALNRADTLQRKGQYPPPKGESTIMGLEIAGEVEGIGSGVTKHKVGDRVMGLLAGGGYAQYVALNEDLLMKIPKSLSFVEAGAISEVWLTAYQAMVTIGELKEGGSVLIHAGASGVGTAAIQLAKHIVKAKHIITTSSTAKTKICEELGATLAISYEAEPAFSKHVLEHTDNKGVDLIIDFIGAKYWDENANALGMDGKVILLATMGGTQVPTFDFRPLFRKRAHIICSTLRNRSLEYKASLIQNFSRDVLSKFEDKTVKPIIDKVLNWNNVAEAHSLVESNKTVGKVVLEVD